MEAKTALGRAPGIVVLHSESGERLVGSIVHSDGEVDFEGPKRLAKERVNLRIKIQLLRSHVKLPLRDLKRI